MPSVQLTVLPLALALVQVQDIRHGSQAERAKEGWTAPCLR